MQGDADGAAEGAGQKSEGCDRKHRIMRGRLQRANAAVSEVQRAVGWPGSAHEVPDVPLEQFSIMGENDVGDGEHVNPARAEPVAWIHPTAMVLALLSRAGSLEVASHCSGQGREWELVAGVGKIENPGGTGKRRIVPSQNLGGRCVGSDQGHPRGRRHVPHSVAARGSCRANSTASRTEMRCQNRTTIRLSQQPPGLAGGEA